MYNIFNCFGLGIILGCTEIELLLRQNDVPGLPLFRSAKIHIQAAALIAAKKATVDEYLPSKGAAKKSCF